MLPFNFNKFFSSSREETEEFIRTASLWLSVSFAANFVVAIVFDVKGTYGRYTTTSHGPRVNGRLDWFGHAVSLFAVYAVARLPDSQLDFTRVALLLPFLIHYVNRSFIHGLRAPEVKPIPVSTMVMVFFFCLVNGTLIAREVTKVKSYPSDYLLRSWQFPLGLLVWFIGFAGNVYHDSLLFALKAQSIKEAELQRDSAKTAAAPGKVRGEQPREKRHPQSVGDKGKSASRRRSGNRSRSRSGDRREAVVSAVGGKNIVLTPPSKSSYKIPHGGLFEYVSGANYLCEIVEWMGYAVMTNFSLAAMAFAWSSFCFIGSRASQHHDWYLAEFKDRYAKLNRKRLIPFVW